MEQELNFVLHSAEDPHHTPNVQLLASCALHLPDIQAGRVNFDHENRSTVITCAVFVRRLARGTMPYIMHYLDECIFPDIELFCYEVCSRTLTTAYTDIDKTSSGFFRVLLNSDLSKVMTPDVRALWEERLGVVGKISGPERYTPSIKIQKAAVAFAHSAQQKLSQLAEIDYSSLKITETIFVMSDRVTKLQRILFDEVNSFPELLTAQSNEMSVSRLPATLPHKIKLHRTLCEKHLRPKSQKRKRKQTDTSPPTGTTTSTDTATLTDTTKLAEATSETTQEKPARKRRSQGKVSAKSKETSTPDKAGDAEQLGNVDSGTEVAHPETRNLAIESPSKAAVSNPQHPADTTPENSGNLVLNEDRDQTPQDHAIHFPVTDKRFYTSNGRILPARKTAAASQDAEPFTQKEELVLYKRYKAVMLGADIGEGTERYSAAEKWFAQWLAIAYVLPGRGVMECIAFYKENKEHFQM
jgi:hypothetical protein